MKGALLLMGAVAFGAKRPSDPDQLADPEPVWATPEGRQETRLQMVDALLQGGTPEAALEMIAQLRADGISGPRVDVAQARALTAIGLLDDATEILEKTVRRHRRDAEAWKALGVLRVEQEDPEGAVEAFRAATRAAPDDPRAWNNLGFTLHSLRQSDEAVEALRTAMRLDPSDARTRNNLGFALVAAGRVPEAWRTFRANAPEADARFNLGLGLELAGDADEARDQYSRALKADPGHTPAQEALARLTTPDAPSPAPPPAGPSPEDPR